ncbi:hypothetical protein HDZ31DRAFT_71588 [Schizophyllum fasciatum]
MYGLWRLGSLTLESGFIAIWVAAVPIVLVVVFTKSKAGRWGSFKIPRFARGLPSPTSVLSDEKLAAESPSVCKPTRPKLFGEAAIPSDKRPCPSATSVGNKWILSSRWVAVHNHPARN